MKPTVVFDTEIYVNYLLIAFQSIRTGKVVKFESRNGEEIDRERLRDFLTNHTLVGFNSRPFDIVICWMAVLGYPVRVLKKVADAIIVQGKRPWDIEREYDFKIPQSLDHIDLIEVAPGVGISLKVYAGRLHAERLQELPVAPNARLTGSEMDTIRDYCINSDIPATKLLFERLKGQLELREAMGKEYGVDLRSKSEAQVAEAVIKARLEKVTGERPERPTIKPGTSYRYKVPDYIQYQTPVLRDLLEKVRQSEFVVSDKGSIKMPRQLAGMKIRLGGGIYRMGIGGLHSSEESVCHVADAGTLLIDRDVTSYYPNIIMTLGLYPKHLGPAFLKVYRKIYEIRVAAKDRVSAAKKAGQKPDPIDVILSESLKIVLNGTFGKHGNKYSILYAPNLLIQVTITGQLALLMFIEWLTLAGIPVISANTDGVVIKCPKDRESDLLDIVKRWEEATGFGTEETRYDAVYSRDVNSYIAVKPGGKVKTKGAFSNPWWDKDPDPRGQFMTSPKNTICIEAVIERILHGTPIEDTIYGCRDVTKFITVQKVTGGARKDGKDIGKVVRFYHSVATDTPIYYVKRHPTTGNSKKVSKSEGAMPIMRMTHFPNDLDFGWYCREAEEMLANVGFKVQQPPIMHLLGALGFSTKG